MNKILSTAFLLLFTHFTFGQKGRTIFEIDNSVIVPISGHYSFNHYGPSGFVGSSLGNGFELLAGAGLNYSESYEGYETVFLPLSIKINVTNEAKKRSPMMSLKLGYLYDFDQGSVTRPTVFLEPRAGINFKFNKKNALRTGLGYNMQHLKITDYYDDVYKYDIMQAVSAFLTFSF